MKSKNFKGYISFLLVVVIVFSLFIPVSAYSLEPYASLKNKVSYANITTDDAKNINKFTPQLENFLKIYLENSYYELNREQAINTMINSFINKYPTGLPALADSLLKTFDPFGGYYPNVTTGEVFNENEYVGFGIIIKGINREDANYFGIVIDDVLDNSPAKKAGIKKGDILVSINGKNVETLGLAAASDYLSTQKKTAFELSRDGKNYTVEMQRAIVKSKTVTYEITDEVTKTAQIRIGNFTAEPLLDEYETAIKTLYNGGYKNLIIDLRDNLGGYLDFMTVMIDMLIPEKDVLMFSLKGKDNVMENHYSTGTGYKFDKLTILTNEFTASAAELYTISLCELKNARRIGEKSYGKGIGQIYMEVNETDVAAITSFECISPKGTRYHKSGLVPEYKVSQQIKKTPEIKYDQLNFVNCRNIKADAKNPAIYALNQRLNKIGYISSADVKDTCSLNTIAAVEILQEFFGLPVGIEKVDYRFINNLTVYITYYSYNEYYDGDTQFEAAKIYMTQGESAVRTFINNLPVEPVEEPAEKEEIPAVTE